MCFPVQQYDKLLIHVLEIQLQVEGLDSIPRNIKQQQINIKVFC
jgi:hypothetical protein